MVTDGYIDWAIRVPGMRRDKRYPEPNTGMGIVMHSQEGRGLQPMVNIHQRDTPPSFMFWLARDGELHQFSPVADSVWCSGNRQANINFWPVEAEGRAPDPLTDAQMRTALRLIAEWEAHTGKAATRALPYRNMWEHREVATMWSPNAGPTACPSERYAALWELLEERMGLEEEVIRIKRLLVDTGVEQAGKDGIDLLQSLRNTQTALQVHVDTPRPPDPGTYSITGTVTFPPG